MKNYGDNTVTTGFGMKIKALKYGRIYRFNVDSPDIADFFLVRFFRHLNINYIPFSLRLCDQLYLREDHSKYARSLVNFCKKNGITTFVVQEGAAEYVKNHTGHVPLHADYFLCPKGMREWWIENGIPKASIREFYLEKSTADYSGIIFMLPFYTAENRLHTNYLNEHNVLMMKVIQTFLKKDVVFKLHPKNLNVMRPFIPNHRLVDAPAEDLIEKYDTIYCFSNCSTRSDCESKGKKYELVEDVI